MVQDSGEDEKNRPKPEKPPEQEEPPIDPVEYTRRAFAPPTQDQLRKQENARLKGGLTSEGIRRYEQTVKNISKETGLSESEVDKAIKQEAYKRKDIKPVTISQKLSGRVGNIYYGSLGEYLAETGSTTQLKGKTAGDILRKARELTKDIGEEQRIYANVRSPKPNKIIKQKEKEGSVYVMRGAGREQSPDEYHVPVKRSGQETVWTEPQLPKELRGEGLKKGIYLFAPTPTSQGGQETIIIEQKLPYKLPRERAVISSNQGFIGKQISTPEEAERVSLIKRGKEGIRERAVSGWRLQLNKIEQKTKGNIHLQTASAPLFGAAQGGVDTFEGLLFPEKTVPEMADIIVEPSLVVKSVREMSATKGGGYALTRALTPILLFEGARYVPKIAKGIKTATGNTIDFLSDLDARPLGKRGSLNDIFGRPRKKQYMLRTISPTEEVLVEVPTVSETQLKSFKKFKGKDPYVDIWEYKPETYVTPQEIIRQRELAREQSARQIKRDVKKWKEDIGFPNQEVYDPWVGGDQWNPVAQEKIIKPKNKKTAKVKETPTQKPVTIIKPEQSPKVYQTAGQGLGVVSITAQKQTALQKTKLTTAQKALQLQSPSLIQGLIQSAMGVTAQKQTPLLATQLIQSPALSQPTKTVQITQQAPLLSSDTALTGTLTKADTRQKTETRLEGTGGRERTVPSRGGSGGEGGIIRLKPPPVTPKGSKRKLQSTVTNKRQGYDAYIKVKQQKLGKGKYKSRGYQKINKRPLQRESALGMLMNQVDTYTNRSGYVKRATGTAIKTPKLTKTYTRLKNKFNMMGNMITEKTAFSIDSPQEKRGIPYEARRLRRAGLIKPKRRKKTKRRKKK